jgi:hypothetical protein
MTNNMMQQQVNHCSEQFALSFLILNAVLFGRGTTSGIRFHPKF